MYLLWDPAVFPCGAALLVEESIEIYCLYAAAAPVLIPKQKTKCHRLETQFVTAASFRKFTCNDTNSVSPNYWTSDARVLHVTQRAAAF